MQRKTTKTWFFFANTLNRFTKTLNQTPNTLNQTPDTLNQTPNTLNPPRKNITKPDDFYKHTKPLVQGNIRGLALHAPGFSVARRVFAASASKDKKIGTTKTCSLDDGAKGGPDGQHTCDDGTRGRPGGQHTSDDCTRRGPVGQHISHDGMRGGTGRIAHFRGWHSRRT